MLFRSQDTKQVDGRGLELSQRGVNECVARGLSVIQGDADTDLKFYPDKGFDFVVLSQTMQATRNPKIVLDEPELFAAINGFIASAARARGLGA